MEDYQILKDTLDRAGSHDLVVEVLHSAMLHLQNNENATIEEALYYGLNEWDL